MRPVRHLCWAIGGRILLKEGTPMKHFLRDVLAAFVAAVLAALVIRLLNL